MNNINLNEEVTREEVKCRVNYIYEQIDLIKDKLDNEPLEATELTKKVKKFVEEEYSNVKLKRYEKKVLNTDYLRMYAGILMDFQNFTGKVTENSVIKFLSISEGAKIDGAYSKLTE